jgi:hypothetical protein
MYKDNFYKQMVHEDVMKLALYLDYLGVLQKVQYPYKQKLNDIMESLFY